VGAVGAVVRGRAVGAAALGEGTSMDPRRLAEAVRGLASKHDPSGEHGLLRAVVLSQRGSGLREQLPPEDGSRHLPPRALQAERAFGAAELAAELLAGVPEPGSPAASVLPELLDDVLAGGIVFASLRGFRTEHCVFRP